MNIEKEFRTHSDQASYSPQDNPLQGPTRAVECPPTSAGAAEIGGDINNKSSDRRGSVGGPTIGGTYAISETIEHRWKDKESSAAKGGQQKDTPQRRESWVDRLEEASKDAIRRSATNTDALIDKLADKLSSWGTGAPTATMPEGRRQSWYQQAFAFVFPPESRDQQHQTMATNGAVFRTKKGDPHLDDEQGDVECIGSDDHYDDTQGSFRLMPESTVIHDPSEPLHKHRMQSQSQQEPLSAKWTQQEGGGAHPDRHHVRGNTTQQPNDPSHWFDADPESGRVEVPPLSTNPPGASNDTSSTSRLLYDSETPATVDNPTNTLGLAQQEQQSRRFHVVESKKSPQHPDKSDPENILDSDFENWKPHPVMD